jgi:hypothetical protein
MAVTPKTRNTLLIFMFRLYTPKDPNAIFRSAVWRTFGEVNSWLVGNRKLPHQQADDCV